MKDLTQLTKKEKNKYEAAAELIEHGDMAVLKKLLEFQDFVEENKEMIQSFIGRAEEAVKKAELLKDGYTPIKGVDYFDGEKGEDAKVTPELIEEIAKKVPVPIVEKVVEKVETIIEKPTVTEQKITIENPVTGKEIVDKVNMLVAEPEFQIDKEHINGLVDDLKALNSKIDSKSVSGGVTNMRIQQAFKYILKTEQPTGLINGSNTTYTVKNDIFAVLSFSLNGETIAQLPNYTIAGKTITFSTALPAAYSGKDFEIKYV